MGVLAALYLITIIFTEIIKNNAAAALVFRIALGEAQQLGEEEIKAIVQDAITASGASSKADMGKVMGAIMPKVKGKADGKLVNQIVMQSLCLHCCLLWLLV